MMVDTYCTECYQPFAYEPGVHEGDVCFACLSKHDMNVHRLEWELEDLNRELWDMESQWMYGPDDAHEAAAIAWLFYTMGRLSMDNLERAQRILAGPVGTSEDYDSLCMDSVVDLAREVALSNELLQRFHDVGWEAIWYAHPGGAEHNRFGARWHAGTWTGPDGDLLCVKKTKDRAEAERYLSPGADSPAEAIKAALAKRAALMKGD